MRRWPRIDPKVLLIGLALLALAVVVVASVDDIAELTASSGSSQSVATTTREEQARDERLHPGGDIQNCLRCHVSPSSPPEEASFCIQCHPIGSSHGSAPAPAHPVRFEALTQECWFCHRPHRGREARDHATNGEASLCAACHISMEGLNGSAKVGESCAQCHNLGLSADHPPLGEGGVQECSECHQMMN